MKSETSSIIYILSQSSHYFTSFTSHETWHQLLVCIMYMLRLTHWSQFFSVETVEWSGLQAGWTCTGEVGYRDTTLGRIFHPQQTSVTNQILTTHVKVYCGVSTEMLHTVVNGLPYKFRCVRAVHSSTAVEQIEVIWLPAKSRNVSVSVMKYKSGATTSWLSCKII